MTTSPAETRESLATRILNHVAANKRKRFRCYELAQHVEASTPLTASECGRLYRTGKLDRERVEVEGRSLPITYYRWLRP